VKLGSIPAKKVIKVLNKIGFEVVRQRGSHVILKHATVLRTINRLASSCSVIYSKSSYATILS